jgi:leucyl/phenylalanyl-tRNA--protein transferase
MIMSTLSPSQFFPPVDSIDAEGLIGFGGQLTPDWLLDAYRHGIFPWPITDIEAPVAWWSPDPRAVIDLDRFHVSRRLRRTCDGGRFKVTIDRDFAGVIRACAVVGDRAGKTWLSAEMIEAYVKLHELGYAHSVEAWYEGKLAGGVYGVSIGGMFAAESKFFRVRDASKVALVQLVERLREQGFSLLDIQQLTPHTARFGAVEIPRTEFLSHLAQALSRPVDFNNE